jgi:hypothetical protein
VHYFPEDGGGKMIICECGEIVESYYTFRDYIRTSSNPSTPTIGHKNCGRIFNFIDEKMPKRYSSKRELKTLAMRYAEKNNLNYGDIEIFLIEVDRMKSSGNLPDAEILITAFRNLANK